MFPAEAHRPYYNSNYLLLENEMELCQQQLSSAQLSAAQMWPQGAQQDSAGISNPSLDVCVALGCGGNRQQLSHARVTFLQTSTSLSHERSTNESKLNVKLNYAL